MPARPAGLTPRTIFWRYVAIAVLGSVANLATQALVSHLLPALVIMSVLAGTATGFGIKFILDKIYVFTDPFEGAMREARKLALYGGSAVGTTLLFWGIEAAFWHFGGTDAARYTGGGIGLALGNIIKYQLDRRLAFRPTPAP